MKIALLTENYFPFVNGVNISVRNLKKALELNGNEVYVVTYKLQDVDYSKLNSDHVILLPAVRLIGKKGKELDLYYNLMTKTLSNMLDQYNFDIMHIQQEFTLSKVAYDYASRHHIPIVYTRHTLWETYFKTFYRLFNKPLNYITKTWFLDYPLRYAHEVIVPSKKMYDLMDKEYNNDFNILPTVIDHEEFKLSAEDKEEVEKLRDKYNLRGKKVILYLGRVSEEKRIEKLGQLMSPYLVKNPDLRLLIVGGGPYLEMLKKRLAELDGYSSIVFTDAVPANRRKLYYHLGDVFSTCSDFETQGLTYDEAMLSSLPLLVREDPVLKGKLKDGVNGFIFHNDREFGEKLQYILTHDLTKMKAEAYKSAASYTLKDWGKDMMKIYYKAQDYYHKYEEYADTKKGETFTFGHYYDNNEKKVKPIKWVVLNIAQGYVTALMEDVVFYHSYYRNDNVSRTIFNKPVYSNNYRYSDVRAFLNGYDGTSYHVGNYTDKGFADLCFDEKEKSLILEKAIVRKPSSNRKEDTSANKIDIIKKDRVYLLSVREVKKFFSTPEKRIAFNSDLKRVPYWLRTAFHGSHTLESQSYYVNVNGEVTNAEVSNDFGLRPVITLLLNKDKTSEN